MSAIGAPPPPAWTTARPARRPQHSLLSLVAAANAAVLAAALVVLASTPLTVSWPATLRGGLVLGLAAAIAVGLQVVLARRILAPLGELWRHMRAVDPLQPGQRIRVATRSVEVSDLVDAFNAMLDRLEEERRMSARRAQAAQDAERRWISLELHDQIGQDLTALLLGIALARKVDGERQAAALDAALAGATDCLQRVRGIVGRLRPATLEELGLVSALVHLCDRTEAGAVLRVDRRFGPDLPKLTADAELGIFRVAQESLTNIARHADARQASLTLTAHRGGIRLCIADDGRGPAGAAGDGTGIRGMRERALLLGATLEVRPRSPGGTEVTLDVPPTETLPHGSASPQPAEVP